jgi:diacylglycerol kinase (ATP)
VTGGRRILVLWNAHSGRKAGLPTNSITADSLRELLARFGLGDELIETASEEDAIARTRKAVAEGYDVVVAAGGDGSIGLVAQELLDTDTALGILPLGSIMNIPRMLGIPRDREQAAAVLRDGATRRIDVGMAEDRPFYEAASIGFHAAIFGEMAAVDQGDRGAIWRSIVAAFRYRPSRMTIELDGDPTRTIRTRALMVAVANGRFMGAGFTVAPDARLDDGRFDVRIFRHYSKRMLFRHGLSIAFGRHAYAPHVDTEHAALVRITGARPLPARADARDLDGTAVELRVRPRALLVVAPPSETGES